MNFHKIIIIMVYFSLTGVGVEAQSFEHPGGFHSHNQIELARKNIASQKQPWAAAYEALIEEANTGLEKVPAAIADFNVPGYYKDAKGHRETMGRLSGDAWVAYSCAAAYQLTSGDERLKYAGKAIQVINAWASGNKMFSGYDGQLAMVDAGIGLVFAAELMRDYDGWDRDQRKAFEKWITSVYLKASTEIVDRENNWGDWGVLGCIASHYYLDMEDSLDRDIEKIRSKINRAIAGDGHMPQETKRGKRGLWYTYFALAPLTSACQIAQNARDADLFHYKGDDGAGIEEALDYLLRYCREPDLWPHYSGNDIVPPRPDQYPGNLFEAMSGIYGKREYEAWVEDERPIMVFGHHYTWSFPTLMSTMASKGNARQPNIILCMTDDQGWGDTGYNGHPYLRTPHLDQISREGVTFTRFYSAAAMCSPTRASCYTGRNPYRMGVTFAMKGMLEDGEIPITTVLKEAGYTTGHFGKWHLGTLSRELGDQKRWGEFARDPVRYYCPPWERDVDVSFVTESKVPTWDPLINPGKIYEGENNDNKGEPYGNDYFTGPGQRVSENTHGDDSRVIMDRALPFIEDAVEDGKPFLAVIWFHTPHSPVVGGPDYRQMYSTHLEDEQHYYACITAMDEQIGRLREQLRSLGVDKNTMLWFCSDNGAARQGSPRHVGSTGGLSGYKLSIREGGIRVPGLLVWPEKIPEPLTITVPCVTSDYFPTILDAIGIPLPEDKSYDGISLLPLLQGERKMRESPIGFLNKEGQEAVWMDDRYKLILGPGSTELFDITIDSAEKKDLSSSLPEITKAMKAELKDWKEGVMKELEMIL